MSAARIGRRGLRLAASLAGIAGIAVLVAREGGAQVLDAFAALGVGVLALIPIYALHLSVGAAGWGVLIPAAVRPRHWPLLAGVWVGSSVNTVVPTGTIGGEAAKARVLVRYGVPGAHAVASVVVDTTTQSASLVAWSVLGVAGLAIAGADSELIRTAALATVVFALLIGIFMVLQASGSVGLLAGAVRRFTASAALSALAGHAGDVDVQLREAYRRPGTVLQSTALRLAARCVLTAEVWLAAYLMGHPIGILEALVLKSLAGAARGIAFFVPNGLGVQEAVFVVAGGALGVPSVLALAVSLATRARELLVSVPALWFWHRLEARPAQRPA